MWLVWLTVVKRRYIGLWLGKRVNLETLLVETNCPKLGGSLGCGILTVAAVSTVAASTRARRRI
jgi:hypothetical protein